MSACYSVREAAAIAELSPNAIRTALEKRVLTSSSRYKVGKAVRHGFSLRDVFFIKLLAEFPFSLAKAHKTALNELVVRGRNASQQWRMEGTDLVFSCGDMTVLVECKTILRRLTQNAATFRWGKSRVVSAPEILSGEPVFRGTRIPLEHVAALFRKGADEREISEDFPQLTGRDLAFARLYSRLGRPPGRPKKPITIRRGGKAA